jgi:valyl-tRNA synthetase
VTRLHRTLHHVEDALAEYQFATYADAMYDFVWRDFCDWYLEAVKPTVKGDPTQRQVLRTVLDATLRLLHPVVPHVTEALWPAVQAAGAAGLDGVRLPPNDLLATASWPDIACRVDDKDAIATFERVQALVSAIRNLRGERKVQPKRRIRLLAPTPIVAVVHAGEGVVETLAGLESVEEAPTSREPGALALPFEGHECLLAGLIDSIDGADAEAERARLDKVIADLARGIAGFRAKLGKAGYVAKAPPAVVDETREKLAKAEAELVAAEAARRSL